MNPGDNFQENTAALAQAAQVLLRKTWCADHPAFVDLLGDGQVLVCSSSGHQHTALGTIGLCDRVGPGDTSPCGHTYLHIERHKTALKLLWAAKRENTCRKEIRAVHFCTGRLRSQVIPSLSNWAQSAFSACVMLCESLIHSRLSSAPEGDLYNGRPGWKYGKPAKKRT